MEYNVWMVEVLSKCPIYIIGTAQVILLLQINIDCIIYGLTGLFELNKDKQEEYI